VIVAAAFVPSAPILIPEVASGAAEELNDVRAKAIASIQRAAASADHVAIVGAGSRTRLFENGVGTFAGFGVPLTVTIDPNSRAHAGEQVDEIGVAASIGVWLLDQTQWSGARSVVEIGPDESQTRLAELAIELAESASSVALVIVADGSAARTEKAPGYLHPDATHFDVLIEQALASGRAQALADLDRAQAQAVMAAGWPAWQVAALAMQGREIEASCDVADAPFGVGYFVASWVCS
jgi:hypothetical protein